MMVDKDYIWYIGGGCMHERYCVIASLEWPNIKVGWLELDIVILGLTWFGILS